MDVFNSWTDPGRTRKRFSVAQVMEVWAIVVILVALGIGACVWSFVAGSKAANKAATNMMTERPVTEVRDPRQLGDRTALVDTTKIPSFLMSESIETRIN